MYKRYHKLIIIDKLMCSLVGRRQPRDIKKLFIPLLYVPEHAGPGNSSYHLYYGLQECQASTISFGQKGCESNMQELL